MDETGETKLDAEMGRGAGPSLSAAAADVTPSISNGRSSSSAAGSGDVACSMDRAGWMVMSDALLWKADGAVEASARVVRCGRRRLSRAATHMSPVGPPMSACTSASCRTKRAHHSVCRLREWQGKGELVGQQDEGGWVGTVQQRATHTERSRSALASSLRSWEPSGDSCALKRFQRSSWCLVGSGREFGSGRSVEAGGGRDRGARTSSRATRQTRPGRPSCE